MPLSHAVPLVHGVPLAPWPDPECAPDPEPVCTPDPDPDPVAEPAPELAPDPELLPEPDPPTPELPDPDPLGAVHAGVPAQTCTAVPLQSSVWQALLAHSPLVVQSWAPLNPLQTAALRQPPSAVENDGRMQHDSPATVHWLEVVHGLTQVLSVLGRQTSSAFARSAQQVAPGLHGDAGEHAAPTVPVPEPEVALEPEPAMEPEPEREPVVPSVAPPSPATSNCVVPQWTSVTPPTKAATIEPVTKRSFMLILSVVLSR